MKKLKIDRGLIAPVLNLASEVGAGVVFWKNLIKSENKKLFSDFVRQIEDVKKNHVVSIEEATKIMKENIILPKDVEKFFGENYILGYPPIPYDRDVLNKYKDTHILVAGCEVSIPKILGFIPDQYLFRDEKFLRQVLKKDWYLIKKEPAVRAFGREFSAQVATLRGGEGALSAVQAVYAISLWHKKTGDWLFKGLRLNTCTLAGDGSRVSVGVAKNEKDQKWSIKIFSLWKDYKNPSIGIVSGIK